MVYLRRRARAYGFRVAHEYRLEATDGVGSIIVKYTWRNDITTMKRERTKRCARISIGCGVCHIHVNTYPFVVLWLSLLRLLLLLLLFDVGIFALIARVV